jgi:hypothetical protein
LISHYNGTTGFLSFFFPINGFVRRKSESSESLLQVKPVVDFSYGLDSLIEQTIPAFFNKSLLPIEMTVKLDRERIILVIFVC